MESRKVDCWIANNSSRNLEHIKLKWSHRNDYGFRQKVPPLFSNFQEDTHKSPSYAKSAKIQITVRCGKFWLWCQLFRNTKIKKYILHTVLGRQLKTWTNCKAVRQISWNFARFLVPHSRLKGGTLVVPQSFDYIGLINPFKSSNSVHLGQTTYLTT